MSRRRRAPGSGRRERQWPDFDRKVFKLVCTGAGRHGTVLLDEHWRLVSPSRPDRETVERDIRGAVFASGGVPRCRKCPESRVRELDEETQAAVRAAVECAHPGRVLRYDVSTGRLLEQG